MLVNFGIVFEGIGRRGHNLSYRSPTVASIKTSVGVVWQAAWDLPCNRCSPRLAYGVRAAWLRKKQIHKDQYCADGDRGVSYVESGVAVGAE